MSKTSEGYGSCAKGCTCPRHESTAPAGAWHFRNHDDGRIYEALPDGSVRPLSAETQERARPPQASDLAADEPDHAEGWWDDGEPARDYTLSDDGPPNPARDVGVSDSFSKLLAQNPSLGDGFDRLSQLRGAGYDGAIDQDGNPTDRRALFKARMNASKEQGEARHRFEYAPTRSERDAAQRDYQAAQDKLDLLPGALDGLHG